MSSLYEIFFNVQDDVGSSTEVKTNLLQNYYSASFLIFLEIVQLILFTKSGATLRDLKLDFRHCHLLLYWQENMQGI